jgi:hypothetical protein
MGSRNENVSLPAEIGKEQTNNHQCLNLIITQATGSPLSHFFTDVMIPKFIRYYSFDCNEELVE